MDMPRRSRSKGRHGAESRSFSALNPMKQIRVSASTPPATASGATPSATRSAASAPGAAQRSARAGGANSAGRWAPCRAADAVRHLGRDPATETLGVDQGDRSDGADAATDPLPVGLHAGPERADDPEPRDGNGLHAPAVLDAT